MTSRASSSVLYHAWFAGTLRGVQALFGIFPHDVPQVATKITVDKYDGRKTKNSSLSL